MELESVVDSVTVFRQGALVKRRASLNSLAVASDLWLSLPGLPATLSDASLSARLLGCHGQVSQLRVELMVGAGDGEGLTGLREMRLREQELSSRCQLLKTVVQELESIEVPGRPNPTKERPPTTSLEQRRSLVELRQQQLELYLSELSELEAEQSRLTQRVGEMLEDVQRNRSLEKVAWVRLAVEAAGSRFPGDAELELCYRVPGAGWAPSYVFHFDRDLTLAKMTMRVSVVQQSGEDWDQVELNVSTAKARAWQELPELAAQRIGKEQPAPKPSGWRPAPTGSERLYTDYDQVRAKAPTPPAPAPAPPANDVFAKLSAKQEVVDADFEEILEKQLQPEAGGAAGQVLAAKAPGPPPAGAGMGAAVPKAKKARMVKSSLLSSGAVSSTEAKLEQLRARRRREAETPPPAVRPTNDLLNYDNVFMPAASHPQRGRLVPLTVEMQVARAAEKAGCDQVDELVSALSRKLQLAARRRLPAGLRRAETLQGFDYQYAGEQRVSVPGDGQYHALALLTRTLPAKSRFVVVPREVLDVFRLAEVEGPTDFGLAAGPADIYQGDEFLVTARLQAVAPGQTLELGLGVEQAIKVVRNSRFQETSSGLMGNVNHLRHQVELQVCNHLPRDIRLEVRERLPQPADEDQELKVKVGTVEPPWQPFEAGPDLKDSAFRWNLKLEPAEEQTLKAEYTIEMSSKYELQGGNRREV